METVAIVIKVIETLAEMEPEIVQGISDLRLFAINLYRGISGQPISDADLATLEARIDALHEELQADDDE